MQKFLRKLRLITDVSIHLKTDTTRFVQLLRQHVDAGEVDFFSSMFSGVLEVFFSSPAEYVGEVNPDSFTVRRKARLFEPSLNLFRIKGQVASTAEGTLVEAVINGSSLLLYFMVFLLVLCIASVLLMLFSGQFSVVALLFSLLHGAVIVSIPYFIIRRGVQRMAYNLERDLYFLIKE